MKLLLKSTTKNGVLLNSKRRSILIENNETKSNVIQFFLILCFESKRLQPFKIARNAVL